MQDGTMSNADAYLALRTTFAKFLELIKPYVEKDQKIPREYMEDLIREIELMREWLRLLAQKEFKRA